MEKRKRNDPSPTKKRSKINTLDAFLGLKPKLKETPPISEKPLASTDTKIAEIFLTKEEKKKRKIEKNLGEIFNFQSQLILSRKITGGVGSKKAGRYTAKRWEAFSSLFFTVIPTNSMGRRSAVPFVYF